jgi:hypothetical protein
VSFEEQLKKAKAQLKQKENIKTLE